MGEPNADSVSLAQPSGAMRSPSFCDTWPTLGDCPDANHIKRRRLRPVRHLGDAPHHLGTLG